MCGGQNLIGHAGLIVIMITVIAATTFSMFQVLVEQCTGSEVKRDMQASDQAP